MTIARFKWRQELLWLHLPGCYTNLKNASIVYDIIVFPRILQNCFGVEVFILSPHPAAGSTTDTFRSIPPAKNYWQLNIRLETIIAQIRRPYLYMQMRLSHGMMAALIWRLRIWSEAPSSVYCLVTDRVQHCSQGDYNILSSHVFSFYRFGFSYQISAHYRRQTI